MRLSVRVTPNSHRDEIIGVTADGFLKIKLAAPAVDGKANAGLIKFLAVEYKKPKNKIKIISGLTSRKKIIEIL
ncbi:MAG: DUF167 domain-containing protein [bacterium]|nr:DUF167 domain-containing protein [bacterium]